MFCLLYDKANADCWSAGTDSDKHLLNMKLLPKLFEGTKKTNSNRKLASTQNNNNKEKKKKKKEEEWRLLSFEIYIYFRFIIVLLFGVWCVCVLCQSLRFSVLMAY